jgi:hypothetical protein
VQRIELAGGDVLFLSLEGETVRIRLVRPPRRALSPVLEVSLASLDALGIDPLQLAEGVSIHRKQGGSGVWLTIGDIQRHIPWLLIEEAIANEVSHL